MVLEITADRKKLQISNEEIVSNESEITYSPLIEYLSELYLSSIEAEQIIKKNTA